VATLAAGESAITVRIPVFADSSPEPDETFELILFDATGAEIVVSRATWTIQNDD
jgi:hypothetical protein